MKKKLVNLEDVLRLMETEKPHELWQAISDLPYESKEGWIPISEYPKEENPTVQRWHKVYGCIVSVKHRRAYAENECEWLNGTLDNTWPELAFEPFFKFLPSPPNK